MVNNRNKLVEIQEIINSKDEFDWLKVLRV